MPELIRPRRHRKNSSLTRLHSVLLPTLAGLTVIMLLIGAVSGHGPTGWAGLMLLCLTWSLWVAPRTL